jgi:L-iditol 2-dehydrogenase
MQELVTRELTVRGAYGYVDEFVGAVEALAEGQIDASSIIERVAPLADGEALFKELAAGSLAAVKVVLTPAAA